MRRRESWIALLKQIRGYRLYPLFLITRRDGLLPSIDHFLRVIFLINSVMDIHNRFKKSCLSRLHSFSFSTTLLARAVREHGLLPLEEAVYRLSGAQAELYGLHERGRVAEGMCADLQVLDPATVGPGPVAMKFDRLDASQKAIETVWVGDLVPFDPVASKRAETLGLKVVCAAGRDLPNLRAILDGKPFVGTTIG